MRQILLSAGPRLVAGTNLVRRLQKSCIQEGLSHSVTCPLEQPCWQIKNSPTILIYERSGVSGGKILNSLPSPLVKYFWKLVNIWRSYGQDYSLFLVDWVHLINKLEITNVHFACITNVQLSTFYFIVVFFFTNYLFTTSVLATRRWHDVYITVI